MNNPYTPGCPVLDAGMFYGRAYDLSEIQAFLNGNQSVSIVGPHKIGKTSLMRHLMRAEPMTGGGIGRENLFVYIDCQSLSTRRQDEIFAAFCTEMAAALHTQGLEPEPALEVAASNPAWTACEGAVRKLNQRGLRVVLMLDDFEQLTINPHVEVNFYNALRSAAGRLRLAFLTCSTRPLIELTYFEASKKILSSPFFNIFAQLFLGLLSESEARNLIRTPLEAAGILVRAWLEDFIYQLAGGHPLALQIACFHAWDSPEDFQEIERHTMQDLDPYFKFDWQDLSPAEREVLCHPTGVLHDSTKVSLQEAGNPALAIVLRNLKRKCLLVQTGGSYGYPSNAWAEFISTHMHDSVTISPTE